MTWKQIFPLSSYTALLTLVLLFCQGLSSPPTCNYGDEFEGYTQFLIRCSCDPAETLCLTDHEVYLRTFIEDLRLQPTNISLEVYNKVPSLNEIIIVYECNISFLVEGEHDI